MKKNNKTLLFFSGILSICIGLIGYFLGCIIGTIDLIFLRIFNLSLFISQTIWYSGIPIMFGFFLILIELVFKKNIKNLHTKHVKINKLTVVLTAYNDESSIYRSVKDFLSSPYVKRVIVISNNSSDRTEFFAKKAGAIVINELKQGYGQCVYRGMNEAVKYLDTELICICEGDLTFRSYDISKMIPYIIHGDIVNGTRIVENLQNKNNQLTLFSHFGNLFVAKLLEFKYLGSFTLTDVGTTYKIIRRNSLRKIIKKLNPNVNLMFNAYFLEIAVKNNLIIIECPITFHKRVGISKGASTNFASAKIGLKMIFGIIFSWRIFE
jgi:glycosyltransferase involved in cell wall biosynthesis